MAVGKISGAMLKNSLDRQGVNLQIDANLTQFDVTNRRVGINNNNPAYTLDVIGNAHLGNLYILGNAITSDTGKIGLGAITGVGITGGQPYDLVYTDGNGNLNFGNLNSLSGLDAFTGNNIALGSNTAGYLVSNAVTLTTSTSVTNALAQLNLVLGKLVPPSPPPFPGASTLSLTSSTTTALITNFTQTDNSGWGNLSVAGGTSVTASRASTYTAGTITSVGPGDSGTVTAYFNGVAAGNRTMTAGTDNGTYGNLIISSDQDYHNVVSTVTAGFWQSFNSSLTGTSIPAGWNRANISDSAAGSTNTITWYYDNSTPGTPTFSNTSVALTSNSTTYSSTIPHFNSSSTFKIKGNIANLSGDMYLASPFGASASGAFATPTTPTYSSFIPAISTPLARNLLTSSYFETPVGITTGFGSASTGPSVTFNNSYSSGTSSGIAPGVTVLYKTGTGTAIDETTIATTTPIGAVSGGSYRIVYSQSSDTPTAVTGSESVWSSLAVASGGTPLGLMDATVVGSGTSGRIQFDTNNYSTGYLPVGPNLSGQNATQYFTMRFAQAGVTTFYLNYTGIVAGIFCAMPGTGGTNGTNVSNGTWNGWLSAGILNGGGVPGPGSAGNGSAGCVTGAVPTFGSLVTSGSGSGKMQIYFGTTNSTSATNNMIYIRFKLTTGQYISALSITAA